MLQTVPVGIKPIWLSIKVPRIECRLCGCVRQIDLGIAEPRRTYMKAFERYILSLLQCITLQDIAALLGVGYDCIKDIYKRYLIKKYSNPKIS
ncbi:MAG: hypothetical protein LBC55_08180 [Desulfovibrio sp.]|nr:hypothetical protein [Desulfovibrio sp.]